MYFPLSFWSSSSSSWIISGKETNFHGRMSLQKEESGGTIICLLNRHLFLRHPNPKQKKYDYQQ